MKNEAKQIELYREYRQYINLTEEEKIAFKQKLTNESKSRTDEEKVEYRNAIMANILKIKEKLMNIKTIIESNTTISF